MKQAQRTTRANAPYLQEDLTEYSVGLFPEHGREDNGDAVKGRLNVDGFFVTIVQRKKLALALTSSSELLLSWESELKWCSKRVPLKERDGLDQGVALLWLRVRLYAIDIC